MRRISKDDCRNAAIKLSDIAFGKKIEEYEGNFKILGDELIDTYIPKPLIIVSWLHCDILMSMFFLFLLISPCCHQGDVFFIL